MQQCNLKGYICALAKTKQVSSFTPGIKIMLPSQQVANGAWANFQMVMLMMKYPRTLGHSHEYQPMIAHVLGPAVLQAHTSQLNFKSTECPFALKSKLGHTNSSVLTIFVHKQNQSLQDIWCGGFWMSLNDTSCVQEEWSNLLLPFTYVLSCTQCFEHIWYHKVQSQKPKVIGTLSCFLQVTALISWIGVSISQTYIWDILYEAISLGPFQYRTACRSLGNIYQCILAHQTT